MTNQHSVLITGGTGSLGYHTAAAISTADAEATVVITGRDQRRAEQTAHRLGHRAVGRSLDLGSLRAVRRFAAELGQRSLPPLSAIICNAGIQTVSGTVLTKDGIEQSFGVNHLAHFLLVRELLPQLDARGRIVFVASNTHDPSRHTGMPAPVYRDARTLAYPTDTSAEQPALTGRRRYTTAKLCNVLTTYELARQLATDQTRQHITVNAFDPGLMPGTGLARDYRGIQKLAWNYLLPALTVLPGLNIHTAGRSGAALARLVLDPALAEVTGRYFAGRRQIRSSADSYDRGKAEDLWRTSVELVDAIGTAD